MKISELGEFPLIDRIAGIVGVERADVIVGIGDDVAVLDCGAEEWVLAKVDSQVEETHYRKDLITPRQLGRRALAINLSDIAAVGGRPTHALVSLALPPTTEVAWVDELYRGLREEGDSHAQQEQANTQIGTHRLPGGEQQRHFCLAVELDAR